MIRVLGGKTVNNKIVAVLMADTKSEVVSNLKVGDVEVDFGSIAVIAKSNDIGKLDSDGNWNWI